MNIAARMESTGLPMRIQATKATVKLLDETKWQCIERDMIDVKASVVELRLLNAF